MTGTATRLFHGTVADLAPGDLLVPGVEHGTSNWGRSAHVYAVTTDFDPVDIKDRWGGVPDTPENRIAFALDQAQQWAAYAADGACTDPRHCDSYECSCPLSGDAGCACAPINEFHVECQREGLLPSCLRVYEIEALGSIEPDPSTDVDAGVRMARARVIREITATDESRLLTVDA